MPRLTDLESNTLPTGNYGFSGQRIDDLGATEYTLVTLAVDDSSSVINFRNEMEKCVQEAVKACKFSPRADNLMVRVVTFGSEFHEFHGFKLLSNVAPDDYKSLLTRGGMTALYDATENSVEATNAYAKKLVDSDFDVNGIVVVITDGEENHSKATLTRVKTAFETSLKQEHLESLVSILVGVNINDSYVAQALDSYRKAVGFTQYVEVDNASANTLAKLADFVSKSISAQSQALGTGGPSKSLAF